MPDGAHVQFPDNMPPDQIRSLILQKFPNAGADAKGGEPKSDIFADIAPATGAKTTTPGIFDDIQPSLPPGFVLDKAPTAGAAELRSLPPGFVLDQPAAGSGGFLANAADFVKSMPEGAARALRQYGRGHQIEAEFFNQPFTGGAIDAGPDLPTGLPTPQGKAGEYGAAVGEALGNPLSYLGAAGLPIKAAGAVLSAMGGKAGEDSGIPGGRLAGAVLGGATAAKTLGPRAVEAAIPTEAELAAAKDTGYAARNSSGVILDPQRVATNFAAPVEQHLTAGPKYAFTGGADGTAPRTLGLLNKLQNPPDGTAGITAANLATIRRQLGDIAGETKDFKPTPDAKAAMVTKRLFDSYLENGAVGDAVAGDAKAFAANTAEANANNAAFERVRTFNQKIADAEEKSAGTSGPSLANTLGTESRQFLRNPKAQRGYTPDEVAAVRNVNRGTLTSNALNQLGRGGAGVVPMVAHLAAAVPAAAATGGASLIPQAALAAGLYGARKVGERMTAKQAQAIIDTLAKRSPLYERRVNALPPAQPSATRGAVLRAVAGGI
jgi:hypothetical protein